MLSFSEIWAAVPKSHRSVRIKVMCVLYSLNATSIQTAVCTADLQKKLKLHFRGQAPKNTSHAAASAAPSVEAANVKGRSKNWWLAPNGVTELSEITGLNLRDTPTTAVKLDELHHVIRDAASGLYNDKHYQEAVGAAVKHLNMHVRKEVGRTSDDGVKMMHQVFAADSNGHTRLVFDEKPKEEWQKDMQEGFQHIMAGVQQGIANVHKHGHLDQLIMGKMTALQALTMLSFLAWTIDMMSAVKPSSS